MPEIVMPRLSDSMEEGTILAWLVKPGEEVSVGREIAEIETDKATMAYAADVAGTLTEILVAEGETVPIGGPIAVIGDSGEGRSGQADAPASIAEAPVPVVAAKRVKASPLARRLARERGVQLDRLQGSGPGGRIVKADVEAGVAGASVPRRGGDAEPPAGGAEAAATGLVSHTAKGEVTARPLSRLQATISRRMAESKATAPHFYLSTEVDMSAAVAARRALKVRAGEGQVVPSFNDMVVKASAIALREMPKANGSYRDGRIELHSRVNVGIAVAAPAALVVPTIFDADRKGLAQIAAEARGLAARVREQTITPPELSGGTFTVSNLGMYGTRSFEAVINAPQAAILAVGAIEERPRVRDGQLLAAQLMCMTLSCDHRILYGAEGAELLARIAELLTEPVGLAL